MKIKNLIWLLLPLFILACSKDDSEDIQSDFGLSETKLSFTSQVGKQSIAILNPKGETRVEVISEDSDWCSAKIEKDSVVVTVMENFLFESRHASLRVVSGNEKLSVLVRQNQKYFSTIPAVKNLTATPGPREVTLSWTAPEDNNFSHVVISYERKGESFYIPLKTGITEYTIKNLLNSDGECEFSVRSADKNNDFGEVAIISVLPRKLVLFSFNKETSLEWLPYYLRTSDIFTTKSLKIGSTEVNEGQNVTVELALDEEALAEYNQENGTNYTIMPSGSYSYPEQFLFTSTLSFQDFDIDVDLTKLQDRHLYALPLTIKTVSEESIDEDSHSVVLIYSVEDLAGWYTVDRLAKCGETADKYPEDVQNRRRYIKRTGATTWETGYLFRCYSKSETQISSGNDVQYISIDPVTKIISIQQGSYAVAENRNAYDWVKQELNIEYLYIQWAGWWTHERMYNRTLAR